MTTTKLEPLSTQEREELERLAHIQRDRGANFICLDIDLHLRLLAQLKAQEEAMRLALEACEAGEVAAAIVALRWSLPKEG